MENITVQIPDTVVINIDNATANTVINAPAVPVVAATATTATVVADNGPVPMSFPALLRSSGLGDRFAHLRSGFGGQAESSGGSTTSKKAKNKRDDNEGKRWVRRKENARFVGNPHIVTATKKDFALPSPSARSTFPEPLPVYLSRNNAVPPATVPGRDPNSANAGRFSMSLKGMRRDLRKAGPRAELLVSEVEDEMTSWLRRGGVLMNPDSVSSYLPNGPSAPIGTSGSIMEVSRTPLQLVWSIREDAFARYVVHCCARYHNIVSYSKDASGQRLTYILRPNVTRPDHLATTVLQTPPATDSELSALEFASESDFASDTRSDVDSENDMDTGSSNYHLRPGPNPRVGQALSDIAESTPGSPYHGPTTPNPPPPDVDDFDNWSVIGGSDVDGGESDLASSVGSLSLRDEVETTPRAGQVAARVGLRQTPLRAHLWDRSRRSASSPSRSPARRVPPMRVYQRPDPVRSSERKSFHQFLFS